MTTELLHCLIAGATGALIKEIVIDNTLTLPKCKDGKFFLGFIGSAIIGAFVGTVIDGSFVTSAMAGFTGLAAIENLILKKSPREEEKELNTEELIEKIALEEGVDQVLALRVAQAESGLNTKAINTNTDGTRDRGLYQINEKWHPEVTDEQAFNAEFSIRFFCKAVKNGNISWWDASKEKWQM